MLISLDQAAAKVIVAKLHSPGNQTQRASASGAAVRATNGDFVQPKMLPATTAKKGTLSVSLSRKKRNLNKVHEVEEDGDEVFFLGEINSVYTDYWTAQVEVNGHSTLFKLNTGAAVTVLSDSVHWLRDISLTETSHTFRGPGNIHLPVKGQFHATLQYGQTSITEPVFVLHNQTCSLLSRTACVKLGLIMRAEKGVEEVTSEPTDFKAEFPALFIPSSPHTSSPHTKGEKSDRGNAGTRCHLSCDSSTEWCAGIAPVLKPNGKVRICVDLTELNKAVQREVHPMPSVDESLAKLGNSKIFSKLDANSGFWQIPLDEESRLLTTFVTPFGRYCFNRLPLGISSAPDIFQRTMSRILEGLDGTICQMDDPTSTYRRLD